MRCWTDGVRSVFQADSWLRVHIDGQWVARLRSETADPYGALGGLAVHPGKDVVWVCGDRVATCRYDLELDDRTTVPQRFADLAYMPDGSLVGVTAGPGPRRVVRVAEDGSIEGDALELAFERHVRWPWGAPYRFGAYDLTFDEHASVRLTSSPFGVMLASTSGHAAVIPVDGPPLAWRFMPVYQGWAVATLTRDGALLSTQHNGRAGDVLWIDRAGRWWDALESGWDGLSPAMPLEQGVACVCDNELRWYASSSRVLARAPMASRIGDLATSADGRAGVFVGAAPGFLRRRDDGSWEVEYDGERIAEWPPPPLDTPTPARWTWTLEGERMPLSIPDRERMGEWEEAIGGARPELRPLMVDDLRQALPPWTGDWNALLTDGDPRRVVWMPLIRDARPPVPTRAAMRELLRRHVDAATPFERFLTAVVWPDEHLPSELSPDADDPLDHAAHIGCGWLVEPVSGANVAAARLTGVLDANSLRWSIDVTLDEGTRGALCPERIGPHALSRAADDECLETVTFPATWRCGDMRMPLELELRPVPWWSHQARAYDTHAREVGRFRVNFVGVRCDAPDAETAVAWLSLHVDTSGWFVARVPQGPGFVLTTFADDFPDATPCGPTRPDPGTRRFVDALVEGEHLELARPFRDDELLALQWLMRTGDVAKVADHLVDTQAVDDLFADDESLSAMLAAALR